MYVQDEARDESSKQYLANACAIRSEALMATNATEYGDDEVFWTNNCPRRIDDSLGSILNACVLSDLHETELADVRLHALFDRDMFEQSLLLEVTALNDAYDEARISNIQLSETINDQLEYIRAQKDFISSLNGVIARMAASKAEEPEVCRLFRQGIRNGYFKDKNVLFNYGKHKKRSFNFYFKSLTFNHVSS